MTERYKRYQRRKFDLWKDKVKKHLPIVTILFYSAKLNGLRIDSAMEKRMGFIIEAINNPYYSLMEGGNLVTTENKLAFEVILEIEVNTLFAFVNALPKKELLSKLECIDIRDCIRVEKHLTQVNDNGHCVYCGHQETESEHREKEELKEDSIRADVEEQN